MPHSTDGTANPFRRHQGMARAAIAASAPDGGGNQAAQNALKNRGSFEAKGHDRPGEG